MPEESPLDPRRLPGDLVGYLDHPVADQVIEDDTLVVRGWVVGNHQTVDRVVLKRKGAAPVDIRCTLPRLDVAAAYPDRPGCERSGFEARIPLAGVPSGACAFELWAAEPARRSVAIFKRQITIKRGPPPSLFEFIRSAIMKAIVALREGRLSWAPWRWLGDLRRHHTDLQFRRPAGPATPAGPGATFDVKTAVTRVGMAQLHAFVDSGARLAFPIEPAPMVSIVLVLYNRAELTLRCLRSLLEAGGPAIEVIILDNASSDLTGELLSRLENVTTIRKAENVGFLHGVNEAATHARAPYLLLLNNDTEVLPGSLQAALDVIATDPGVGAVGARLILPDGSLQEAGSIIWSDGSCAGYGRGGSPHAPEFQFRRDVDYCSGAFLLTPRALFEELGGLDRAYEPAYYEEVDYCVRLLKRGLRIVYEPRALISHFEFASSRSDDAIRMQVERRSLFVQKHSDWLQGQQQSVVTPPHVARTRLGEDAKRILYIDDRVPFDHLGSGFPRARMILQSLIAQGHAVTLYPTTAPNDEWAKVYAAVPRELEVMLGRGSAGLRKFLDERRGFYDCIIVSRPHNVQILRAAHGKVDWPPASLIYDAEALFSLRDAESSRVAGKVVTDVAVRIKVEEEIRLAHGASRVLCVSPQEARWFEANGHPTTTLAHTVECTPTARPFHERRGLLFVGALNADDTPNSDSVAWFVEAVLPLIRARLGADIELTIIGECPPPRVQALAGDAVHVIGRVDDLTPWFNATRVFIAPTRYAAGIPLKILHAAALGVPVACTSLLQRQLGWTDGVELVVGDDAEGFAAACRQLYQDEATWSARREAALAKVADEYSQVRFARALADALHAATSASVAT
ncbi:MAG: glycosyltransferase [Gemmatimonadales bacterium]|nr:glycosyltransferase [Gemmatimonadales bacterium]